VRLITKPFPGEPYLVTALGAKRPKLATACRRDLPNGRRLEPAGQAMSVDCGRERFVTCAVPGRVRYVSVSGLWQLFATGNPGKRPWQPHQRVSSQAACRRHGF